MTTDHPGWVNVPAHELAQHNGRIISIYRSQIPTRIVDVSEPDADGVRQMVIEWAEPTSAVGGLIRHEAGRRETCQVAPEDEYLVRIDEDVR